MKISKKILFPVCIILSVVLVISAVTIAYKFNKSNGITNTFVDAKVGSKIEEDITSLPGVKKNVKVTNTGTAEAYVRACVSFSWVDENGNVYSEAPEEGVDFNVIYPDNYDWIIDGSIYYCKNPVAAGESSPILFTSVTPVKANVPTGYTFCVEIASSSIQSLPISAVQNNWGVTVSNGKITG